jgi:sugar O-acyltransferase (sialic acid O-acetyltransferase NeuD family)
MISNKNNIIIGAGSHSRTILENLYLLKKKKIKIFDTNYSQKKNNLILKSKVLGDFKDLDLDKYLKSYFFLAIGDNAKRKKIFNIINKKNNLPNLVSPKSHLSTISKVGIGNFFNHYSYIGPNVSVGNNNIINTYSLIEHDVSLGSHSHICPGVKIGGSSSLGDNVFIGIGSVIIDKINICSDVIIGAGSIIKKDIKKPGKYVVIKNKIKKL